MESTAPDEGIRLDQRPWGETLVLHRPTRRNALTLQMWQDLGRLVRERSADSTEPLYLIGSDGYFCSGADLGALTHARQTHEDAETFVRAVVTCLLSLHTCPRETVALVHRGAAGGGVEIMAACDRRVGIEAPDLVFPFGHHGMVLDGFTAWRLRGLVGPDEAARLTDGRHVVSADEARRLGLLDELVEHPDLLTGMQQPGPGAAPTASATRPRGDAPAGYLREGESLEDAVQRAMAPMMTAISPAYRQH